MATLPLLPLLKRYIEQDPLTAARLLEIADEKEAIAIVKALPAPLAAQIFIQLRVSHASAILKEVPPDVRSAIVQKIQPDQAAAILVELDNDTRATLLELLPEKTKKQIQDLLTFPENSAGRIMTTHFIAFDQEIHVKEAIIRIRQIAGRYGASTYTYVVDTENHLAGVLNMRDLLLAPGDEFIKNVMHKEVFSVDGFMDRSEVAMKLNEKRYLAAPVVDAENHLLGVVKVDQLIGEIQKETTEDILKMVGAGEDERTFSPLGFALKKRFTWLTINLATAFLAAWVVSLFEGIISRITVLAVFLPIVAGQGGNAGAQSLAVVMRGLVMREIQPAQARKIIFKEGLLGAINGVLIGIITAGIAWIWHGNPYLGLVIGLAMIVNLTAAGISGAAIPLVMKALGFDPAQSSTIIQTTVTDVVGFFSFLGFAVLFQRYLI